MKKAFDKIKAFFITFKGLSVAKNYLRPESAPSIILAKLLKNILQLLKIAEITRLLNYFSSLK